MIIKVKKYVAKVSQFKEHDDGSITKEISTITLKGQRFSEATVWKQIPRDAKLISHGYVEQAFEVDADKLTAWLNENGKAVEADKDGDK